MVPNGTRSLEDMGRTPFECKQGQWSIIKPCSVTGHQQDIATQHYFTFSGLLIVVSLSVRLPVFLSLCTLRYLDIPVTFSFFRAGDFYLTPSFDSTGLMWNTHCSYNTFHPVLHGSTWYSLWHTNLINANQIPANAIKRFLREYHSLLFAFEVGLDCYIGLRICQAETSTADLIRVEVQSRLIKSESGSRPPHQIKILWIPYGTNLVGLIPIKTKKLKDSIEKGNHLTFTGELKTLQF